MNDSSEPVDRVLDLYREEYVRLHKRYESLVDSSFDDFKLLAAIGVLIAWPPLATSDLFRTADSGLILFLGFVGILFIIAVLAVRDVLKWTLIEYYLQEMLIYEREIQTRLGQHTETFQFAHKWSEYRKHSYVPVFVRFSLLFVVLLLCFPCGVLFLRSDYLFGGLYVISFVMVLGIYVSAGRALRWI